MRALRPNWPGGLGRRGYRQGHFAAADSATVLGQGRHRGEAPKSAQGATGNDRETGPNEGTPRWSASWRNWEFCWRAVCPLSTSSPLGSTLRGKPSIAISKTLQEAGYPITGEGGLLSHPRLFDRPRQARPAIRFNGPEIDALLWAAGQVGTQHPFQTEFAAATTKLRGMLAAQPDAASPVADSVVLWQQRGEKDYSTHQAPIKVLGRRHSTPPAMSNSLSIPGRLRTQVVRIRSYRMLSVQDGLYCLGKTSTHAEITMLAVDRVVSIRLTDYSVKVAPGFSTRGGTNGRPSG